jgi:hypothetical protein
MLCWGIMAVPSHEGETLSRLMHTLAAMLERSVRPEHYGEVSLVLSVMSACTNTQPGVHAYLAAMTTKLSLCTEELGAETIRNALYGLQGMRGGDDGVSEMLLALAPMIAASSSSYTGRQVGNALYGLQGLRDTDHGVSEVLAALSPKVALAASQNALNAQEIGNALYGLIQCWEPDSLLSKSLLAALDRLLSGLLVPHALTKLTIQEKQNLMRSVRLFEFMSGLLCSLCYICSICSMCYVLSVLFLLKRRS